MANALVLIEIREDGARVVKKSLDDVTGAGRKTEDMADDLKKALGAIVSAQAVRRVVGLADSYANMMNRLRVVTNSQKELNTAMEGVAEMSRRTRSSLEANVDMYARMAINTKDLGLAYEDVIRFADQVNKAVLLSGVTAREAQWGMVQFSQALASNALRGDELRAVLEQLPVVTDVIAKHFGVTRGELRQLGFEGRITAKEILDAFEEAGTELDERFAKRLPTIDQAMTVLHGTFTKFIGTQDQMIQGTASLARALLWVSDNMDTLGRVAQIAGIAIASYFGTAMVMKFKAMTVALNKTVAAFVAMHPALFAFSAAAITVGVYADKIKLAAEGTATLSDLLVVLRNRALSAGETVATALADAFDIDVSGMTSSLGIILRTAAGTADKFAGFWVASRYVAEQAFSDIATAGKKLWNASLSMWEGIADVARAALETIKDIALSAFLGISSAMNNSLRGFKEAAKGNFEGAADYAKQAALSIQNAFAVNPLEHFQSNMEQALGEDSMARFRVDAERSGEGYAEAWSRGFAESNMMVAGLEKMMDDAEALAQGRDEGEMAFPGLTASMTPQELEIYKRMTGDVQKHQQALQNLANVGLKDAILKIKLLQTSYNNGNVEQTAFDEKMKSLKDTALSYTDSLAELNKLKKHGVITNEEYADSLDTVKEKQLANEEAMKQGLVTAQQYGRELAKIRMQGLATATDIGSGFERGFGKVALAMTDFATAAENVVVNAFGGMEDALVSFVTTGKVDFRGLVNSMLGDLTRLITRMMMAKIFQSLASSAGGPWGAIFGAASAAGSGGGGRASGGPISAGTGYTVGENGSEPFVAGQQGRIVNDAARLTDGEGGGVGNVTIINVGSEEEIYDAMGSSRGERIIVNRVSRNKEVIQEGVS